jgi:hypothetical protein
MNKQIVIKDNRVVSTRNYKNSNSNTEKSLDFRQYSEAFGVEYGSAEHRAQYSRWCQSETSRGVAELEKFRNLGLVLDKITETVSKDGKTVTAGTIRFHTPKVPKVKETKEEKKQDKMLEAIASLPEDKLEQVLAILKANQVTTIDIAS